MHIHIPISALPLTCSVLNGIMGRNGEQKEKKMKKVRRRIGLGRKLMYKRRKGTFIMVL